MANNKMPIGYKIFFGALSAYLLWQLFRPKTAKPSADSGEANPEGQRTASTEDEQTQSGGGYYSGGYGGVSYGAPIMGVPTPNIIQMTPPSQVVYEDPVIINSSPRPNPYGFESPVKLTIPKPMTFNVPRTGIKPLTQSAPSPIPEPVPNVRGPIITTVRTPILSSFAKNILIKKDINQNLGA